jgi:hypothetical protein
MASFDTTTGEAARPLAQTAAGQESRAEASQATQQSWRQPLRDVRTTRGGAGSAAGATPKKAYRPSASARPRPAGKKPDSHPR